MLDHDLGKPSSPEAFNLFDRKFLVAYRKFLVAYQHRCHRVPRPPSGSTPYPAFRPDISSIRRGRAACASGPESKGVPQATRLVTQSVSLFGDAIANGEHLDLLNPRRRAEFDDVALMRFHQRSGDR